MTATFSASTGIGDNPGYAFTALAVAKGIMGARHGGIGPAIVHKIEDFGNDPVLVRADQLRGARRHPFGPFGRLPHDPHPPSERRPPPLHPAPTRSPKTAVSGTS